MKPTQEQVIAWAREAGWTGPEENVTYVAMLERFANLVAAAEREACAKVLDEMAEKDKLSNYYKVAALAIRERGAP